MVVSLIVKHARLALFSVKLEVMDRMEDAVSFSFLTIGTVLRIALTLVFFEILYGHVQEIGGWGRDHMYVLLGTWFFIDGIAWATYIRGSMRIARMIENGRFDSLLVKPVELRPYLSYAFVDIVFSVPAILMAVGMIIYGALESSSELHIASYLVFLALAIMIHYSLSIILSSINFFYILEMPGYLWNSVQSLGRYPISIYKGMAKFALSFIVPLAFMFTIPVEAFFGEATVADFFTTLAVAVVFFIISSIFWKLGIKNYESANG